MIWKFTLFSLIIFCQRFQTHYCYPFQAQARSRNVRNVPVSNLIRRSRTLLSFPGDFEYGTDNSNTHATRIYFDIGIGVDETIRRPPCRELDQIINRRNEILRPKIGLFKL